jgi:hypothetical protein
MNDSNALDKGEAEPDAVMRTGKESEEVGPDPGNVADRLRDLLPSLGSAER